MSLFLNCMKSLSKSAPPIPKPPDTLLRAALISDTHVTAAKYRLFFFRPAMKKLHRFQPDLLLIAGDSTDNGNERNWRAFSDTVRKYCCVKEKLIALGNHDTWLAYDESHDYLPAKENYLSFSNALMGTAHREVYFKYEQNGVPFLVLGSEGTSVSAELSEAQLTWLQDTLETTAKERGGRPTFVVNHHPMNHTHGVGENEHGMGVGGGMSERLQALLDGYENIVYICGHIHFGLQTGGTRATVQRVGKNITSICLPCYEYGELFNGPFASPGYPLIGAGLLMDVGEDRILLRGCNFLRGRMIPGFTAEIRCAN